ncbi:hypothetical protein ACFLS9_08850 [Bacteroidota bacterium]
MQELTLLSQIILYVILSVMGVISVIVLVWQINVLKGKKMKNPDGSFDDWHEQKIFYGIALSDIFIACPLNIAGIVLVFISPRWGFYLLAMVSFWWVWANTMTTSTSLRFEKPKITLMWIIAYPFEILIGLLFILWSIINFDIIYSI